MKSNAWLHAILCSLLAFSAFSQNIIDTGNIPYKLYPEVNIAEVNLPSPFLSTDGIEYVVALTMDNTWAIIPVTLNNERGICPQLIVDTIDFPDLTKTGLHNDANLKSTTTITGRTLDEITKLARPGGLSTDGFLAADENILTVLLGDNHLVKKMDLTHPQLAKCLFHVLNMMDEDLKLQRWVMAHHEWEHIVGFKYNSAFVEVQAYDTKGGQQSIFDDGIMGAFHIKLWRQPDQKDQELLEKAYGHLKKERFDKMVKHLSFFNTGEMQPQYIMRYGFYEGHTGWRADPVAIAYIFGLVELPELLEIFDGELDKVLLEHYVE